EGNDERRAGGRVDLTLSAAGGCALADQLLPPDGAHTACAAAARATRSHLPHADFSFYNAGLGREGWGVVCEGGEEERAGCGLRSEMETTSGRGAFCEFGSAWQVGDGNPPSPR